MTLNYLGAKTALVDPLIMQALRREGMAGGFFADAMAGTHAVGMAMQKAGWRVHANDLMAYSAVVGVAAFATAMPAFAGLVAAGLVPARLPVAHRLAHVIMHLQALGEDEGPVGEGAWFVEAYCEGGAAGRLYFSAENGRAIARMRQAIEGWRLTQEERCLLVSAVLHAADRVANCTSVYGAFLKQVKASARRRLVLALPEPSTGFTARVTQFPVVEFVRRTRGLDVLYLDPPYNDRQYAANYHLLETIARWDEPDTHGKTGLRDYEHQKSDWCRPRRAHHELEAVLAETDAKLVLLSYSSDGLMADDLIMRVLGRFGLPYRIGLPYKRYRSDAADARDHRDDPLEERLYVLRMRP